MTDSALPQPAWMAALSPYLTDTIAAPLPTPVRSRIGDLIPDVRGAVVRFPRWTGAAFSDDLARKSAGFVELDGEHLFAELAVLRLLERQGWEGRWVITTGAAHGELWKLLTRWQDVPRADQRHAPIEDPRARQLLSGIAQVNKPARWGGCWDVFAWRGDEFVFLACQRSSSSAKEKIKPKQAEWMRMAMAYQPGIFKPESFGFVEWDYA